MSYLSEKLEKEAGRTMRLSVFRDLLAQRGTRHSGPYYVNTADELEIFKLGGPEAVEDYRAVKSDDETVSIGGLRQLEGRLGLTTSLASETPAPIRLERNDDDAALDDTIRRELLKRGLNPDYAGIENADQFWSRKGTR